MPEKNAPSHTPGPWRVAVRRGYVTVMAGPQSDVKAVADCNTGGTDYHERVANCILIAAAPDLLEACRQCEELADRYDPDCEAMELLVGAMKVAAAAYRKATSPLPE